MALTGDTTPAKKRAVRKSTHAHNKQVFVSIVWLSVVADCTVLEVRPPDMQERSLVEGGHARLTDMLIKVLVNFGIISQTTSPKSTSKKRQWFVHDALMRSKRKLA
jgi:hypothetical protein